MSMYPTIRIVTSDIDLNESLGRYIADIADAAINARGTFLLATSGGSLPLSLSTALNHIVASGRNLRAESWVIVYVDERHVALDSDDSNHGATMRCLKKSIWWQGARVLPIDPSLPLEECAAAYEVLLKHEMHKAGGNIDLVLLGMGPDGHTASLFPGHPLLVLSSPPLALVVPISDSPKPPLARVTLTLSAICGARDVAFIACGKEKAVAIAAVAGTDAASYLEDALPAARVHARGKSALFFTDVEGAALIGGRGGNGQ
jgi:6-phosphogluconolactonase